MICEGENTDPYIKIYENALSNDLCKEIIKTFDANSEKHIDGTIFRGIDKTIKNTKEMYFCEKCLNHFDHYLFESLNIHLEKYLKEHKWTFLNMTDSGYQIQKYIANEGFYSFHSDTRTELINNKLSNRVITFLWYLNDVEKGGETLFTNLKIKPKTGSLLFFPSTWTYIHSGTMPISNDKYIITGWILENFN